MEDLGFGLPILWLEKFEDGKLAGEAGDGKVKAGSSREGRQQLGGWGGTSVRKYPRTTWALWRQRSWRLPVGFLQRLSAEREGPKGVPCMEERWRQG